MNRLEYVIKYGRRARGKAALVCYLKGKKITRQEAIEAKCYECMGYCANGIHRCTIKECPLYKFSPYGGSE